MFHSVEGEFNRNHFGYSSPANSCSNEIWGERKTTNQHSPHPFGVASRSNLLHMGAD